MSSLHLGRASAQSNGMTDLLVKLNDPFRERLIQKVPDLMPSKKKWCLAILFRQSLDVASHAWWNGHQKVIICIEDFATTPSHSIGQEPASLFGSRSTGQCLHSGVSPRTSV